MQHHTLLTSLHQELQLVLFAPTVECRGRRSEVDRDSVREQGSVL